MYISEDQTRQIKIITEQLENVTGVELVAVVVDKSDTYPEIPWKAFAMAASISAFCILAQTFLRPDWITAYRELFMALAILGAGAAAALLTLFWRVFARFFLDDLRAAGETEQYARSQFLEQGIHRTKGNTGMLLLISLFERKVVIHPDSGIRSRIEPETLTPVIAKMTTHLRKGNCFDALREGLDILEKILTNAGFRSKAAAPDRIRDEFIQQKGPHR